MTRSILIIAAALLLAGCATTAPPEPVVRTVTVEVPVAVKCVPAKTPEPPAYVDTDAALKAAAGPEDRYQLLAAGRIQRNQRLSTIEPILRSCRAP